MSRPSRQRRTEIAGATPGLAQSRAAKLAICIELTSGSYRIVSQIPVMLGDSAMQRARGLHYLSVHPALLRRRRCGDGKGNGMTFDEFLDRELDGLTRYARVLTGNRQEAHDMLADSMIKVQLHWRRIADLDNPLAYVRRVVTNTFLQQRRSWAQRMIHPSGSTPPDHGDLDDRLSRVESRLQLHQLLELLPRQQRVAIVLRHYLDLSDDDIAATMGCSSGTVRTHISRGLATLRPSPKLQTAVTPPLLTSGETS